MKADFLILGQGAKYSGQPVIKKFDNSKAVLNTMLLIGHAMEGLSSGSNVWILSDSPNNLPKVIKTLQLAQTSSRETPKEVTVVCLTTY